MLDTYRHKRDFARTSEPEGRLKRRSGSQTFVVQRHRARREHYDFRLEIDGVLKSWAVTRGPSARPGTKRLAVRTEDHPLEYASFEGVIPPKAYGAGPVMIWDNGGWSSDMDPIQALADGHFKFTLTGKRMRGQWALVRLKGDEKRENWLLVKDRDAFAEADDTLAERFDTSALTGRDFAGIIAGRKGKPIAAPPLPAFIPPMLCTAAAAAPEGREWVYEMKYDGYRLQLAVAGGAAVVRTRNGHDWTDRFPTIAAAAALLPVYDAVLDGEAVVLDERGVSDFPALVSALEAGSGRIAFVAFDILQHNGTKLAAHPLAKRRAVLEKVLAAAKGKGAIRLAPVLDAAGDGVLSRIAAAGGEGLIAKRRDAQYRSGRSPAWLKVKVLHREDVVIVGYAPSGKGRGIASLLAAVPEKRKLRYAGRIGAGYSDRTLASLQSALDEIRTEEPPATLIDIAGDIPRDVRWVAPRLTAAVRFGGWTADRRMRAAAFLGLREDTPMATRKSSNDGQAKPAPPPQAAEPPVMITHAGRVVFPKTSFTKGDIADYYRRIAPRMLPHLNRRPVSLLRAPDSIDGAAFFQRHPMPAMKRGIVRLDTEGKVREPYMAVDGVTGLMTAVQFGAIEFHGWGATTADIDAPDRVIFDLDPSDDVPFSAVRGAAGMLRKVMESAGLQSFPLVSGGKGIHVVVPLDASQSWDVVEAFSSGVARKLARLDPDRFIATASKARRTGRIFIDWLRNKRSATAILPYSLRARAGNTVAVPVTWRALGGIESADAFHPADVKASGRDPWQGFFDAAQSIPAGVLALLA